jgi:branched-chain amino acid transport system permease protein
MRLSLDVGSWKTWFMCAVLTLTGLGLFELCRRRFSLHWERIQEEIEQLIQHREQP